MHQKTGWAKINDINFHFARNNLNTSLKLKHFLHEQGLQAT